MRITNTILFNTTLANIQQYNARLLQTSEEASSGRRLQRPSDDPTGTRRVLDLRGYAVVAGAVEKPTCRDDEPVRWD